MKRLIFLLVLIAVFTACNKKDQVTEELPPVIQNNYELLADESVDIDLTATNDTSAFGQISSMLVEPEDYEGKTVKLRGVFGVLEDEYTHFTFNACVVKNATGNISQGIEFVLADESATYPQENEEITIKGRVEIYEMYGCDICRLIDAEIC